MEGTARPRLHPLLTAAALSATVFSAIAIGALAGFLPNAQSGTKQSAPALAQVPADPAAPAAAPEAPPMPAAAPTIARGAARRDPASQRR